MNSRGVRNGPAASRRGVGGGVAVAEARHQPGAEHVVADHVAIDAAVDAAGLLEGLARRCGSRPACRRRRCASAPRAPASAPSSRLESEKVFGTSTSVRVSTGRASRCGQDDARQVARRAPGRRGRRRPRPADAQQMRAPTRPRPGPGRRRRRAAGRRRRSAPGRAGVLRRVRLAGREVEVVTTNCAR